MRRLTLLFVLALLLAAPRPGAAADPATLDSLYAAAELELPRLERAVLERNSSLAAMRAMWDAMEARADRAGAWDNPKLDVMVAPRSLGSSEVDAGYSVGITQMVPLFGQRGWAGKSSRATARAAAEDYRAMRLDMLRMTRELYFRLYLAARGAEVNREQSDLLGQFRRVALQKYSAGTAGQQDALQAETELAMVDHEGVALSRTRRVIQARLRALLHDDSGRPLPEPPRELPHVAHVLLDTTFASAAGSRPELRAKEAARDARRADLEAAKRMRLPELMLQARYDRFMDEPEWRPMVGAGLNLPIWFGKLSAGVREARAEVDQAELSRQALLDSIRAEVEAAQARVEETAHELSLVETRVVPASQRALSSVRAGYESNRSDFLALLTAEREAARARLERYRAEAEYHIALADLERAIGMAPPGVKEERR